MRVCRSLALLLALQLVWAPAVFGLQDIQVPPDARILTDVEYGKAGKTALLMDLALPKDASEKPQPAVVWIHGGGWSKGSKTPNVAALLVGHGYVTASVDYRLTGKAAFPAQIHDCKAAVRFLRAHARDYGIDPERIGVWGASAGGHLAALLGTTGGVKELEGNSGSPGESSRVQAVCDFFGPADLMVIAREMRVTPTPVEGLLRGPVVEKTELARLASPISHVTRDDAPILIVHGDKDELVPISQSESFYEALKKAGVDAELIRVKNAGHGFPESGTEPSRREIMRTVVQFFDKCLRRKS